MAYNTYMLNFLAEYKECYEYRVGSIPFFTAYIDKLLSLRKIYNNMTHIHTKYNLCGVQELKATNCPISFLFRKIMSALGDNRCHIAVGTFPLSDPEHIEIFKGVQHIDTIFWEYQQNVLACQRVLATPNTKEKLQRLSDTAYVDITLRDVMFIAKVLGDTSDNYFKHIQESVFKEFPALVGIREKFEQFGAYSLLLE